MKLLLGIILCIPLLLFTTVRTVKYVGFKFDCAQHIKRAADANTVDLARQELKTVLAYCDDHRLTSGTVSILFHQPKNDIGFWYTNMSASLRELNKVTDSTSQLERSNLLIKLRETLIDHGERGITITCPNGITVYPNNMAYFIWGVFGTILLCVGAYLIMAFFMEL